MDINIITENLTELLQNTVNMTSVYYDIFLNPEPMDVELTQWNEDGELVTITIPNRAKDNQRAKLGQGSPEGSVEASEGTLYVDEVTQAVYVKASGTGAYGWSVILTQEGVAAYVQQYLVEQGYLNEEALASYLTNNSYTTESDVADIISRVRGTLVTTISASSTDDEYPSAKCVYDAIEAGGGGGPTQTFVTTITASSTDSEYPSAKAVWDLVDSVRSLIDGIDTILDSIIAGN